jgi:hypothetical protein
MRLTMTRRCGRRVVNRQVSLVLLVALLFMSGDGHAVRGDLTNDPAEVLKKYVSLDVKGARLEAMSWETLRPYISWSEEPLWGQVVVIADYQVVDDIRSWEIVNMLEVVIPVRYRVLGAIYWETASFLPKVRTEEVLFRVKAVQNRWRITEPVIPPHVGRRRIINFVRQAILEEADESRHATLVTLRDELGQVQ